MNTTNTAVTDEMVERLREDAEYMDGYVGFIGSQDRIVETLRMAADRLAAAAIPAEPVAWQYAYRGDWGRGDWVWMQPSRFRSADEYQGPDYRERPLYAAPRSDGLRDALEAVNAEIVLTGQLKELVDAALADTGDAK